MGKLIVQQMMTLDGYVAGPRGEIDWHRPDEEYEDYAMEFLDSVDMLIFGRVTYELMSGYWPGATGEIAKRMNRLPKLVASTSLKQVEWENAELIRGPVVESVRELKRKSAQELAIMGSLELCSCLMKAGLVDEYQITVVPVALGQGKPLFVNLSERLALELLYSETMRSGCVQLIYRQGESGSDTIGEGGRAGRID